MEGKYSFEYFAQCTRCKDVFTYRPGEKYANIQKQGNILYHKGNNPGRSCGGLIKLFSYGP